jgi:hypothetical protein
VPGPFRSHRARRRFLDAYARARQAFFAEVATVIGGVVATLDTGTGAVDVSRPLAKH